MLGPTYEPLHLSPNVHEASLQDADHLEKIVKHFRCKAHILVSPINPTIYASHATWR